MRMWGWSMGCWSFSAGDWGGLHTCWALIEALEGYVCLSCWPLHYLKHLIQSNNCSEKLLMGGHSSSTNLTSPMETMSFPCSTTFCLWWKHQWKEGLDEITFILSEVSQQRYFGNCLTIFLAAKFSLSNPWKIYYLFIWKKFTKISTMSIFSTSKWANKNLKTNIVCEFFGTLHWALRYQTK